MGTASEGGSSAAILFHFLRKQLLHLRLAEEVTDEDHERRTAHGERVVHHEGLFGPARRDEHVGGDHAAGNPAEKACAEVDDGGEAVDELQDDLGAEDDERHRDEQPEDDQERLLGGARNGDHVVEAHHEVRDDDGLDGADELATALDLFMIAVLGKQELGADPDEKRTARHLEEREVEKHHRAGDQHDAQGDGVVVKEGQNIVLDFGGHTYNVNGNLVGSAGTETNGMQLLKGSVVTLKNGTLTSDKAEILVQNYCNLTLDGVNLDGTQSGNCDYVLSNNFGNTVVTGKTTITAGTGKVAFDLWYGMSDTYKDGVSITFDKNFTGTVTGKVEYGAQQQTDGWEGKTSLSIQGGTFNTQFVASSGNDMKQANIRISGGSFTSGDVLDYLAPGFELKKNANGTFGVVKKPDASNQTNTSATLKVNPKTGFAA